MTQAEIEKGVTIQRDGYDIELMANYELYKNGFEYGYPIIIMINGAKGRFRINYKVSPQFMAEPNFLDYMAMSSIDRYNNTEKV